MKYIKITVVILFLFFFSFSASFCNVDYETYKSTVYNSNIGTKWNKENLNVYIKHSNFDIIQNSFKQWENALDSKLKFLFVSNSDNADIIVEELKVFDVISGKESMISGKNNTLYSKKEIKKSIIYIPAQKQANEISLSNDFITNISLHEIGHSLGIFGHSKNTEDVMFYEGSKINKLSENDINTIKVIYFLNEKLNINYKQQIKEAKFHIKAFPNEPTVYQKAGNIYKNNKKYRQAIKHYKKAIKLAPENNDYKYSLCTVYAKQSFYKKAYDCLDDVLKQEPYNLKYLYSFAMISYKIKQIDKIKFYYQYYSENDATDKSNPLYNKIDFVIKSL